MKTGAIPVWPMAVAVAAIASVPAPLRAESAEAVLPQSQSSVFLPEDFARFAPRNALDMLGKVPGFAIQEEEEARGLGQASGNILINGARLSSKSDTASDQLAKIPANNVVRIELIDAASLDIPGLAGRVANIVVETGGVSGQFEWEPHLPTEFATGRWMQGKVSVSGTLGPVDYTLGLTNTPFRGGTGGGTLISAPGGAEIERRLGRTRTLEEMPKLSGVFRIDGPGSSVANVNLSYQWYLFRYHEWEDRFLPAGPDDPFAQGLLFTRDRSDNYEIGADFEFALGPGRLKLIGLDSSESGDFRTESVTEFTNGANATGNRFLLGFDSGERIARAEYRWPMLGGDWQLSTEAAFNRLDNVAGLFALDPSGDFVELPFPEGTGGVREDRYEAILSHGRKLAPNLTLQLTLGGEYSKIAQTGPNAEMRSFRRPKGSLQLAWAPSKGLDISFELRRSVGQLDFADFLADVNLDNENTNAGNNQLVPSQSWRAELEVTRNFGAWGSATLTLYDERIEDFITVVPLSGPVPGELVESNGNVDSALLRGFSLEGTLNLDPIGFRGARIDLRSNFQHSSLIDPVTGEKRVFDKTKPHNIEADFRHDIPGSQWAWGINYRNTKNAPYFRLAEAGYDYLVPNFGAVFVEHKDVFGLTVRVRAANLFDGRSILYRTIYTGPRNTSPAAYIEDRSRRVGMVWAVLVKGSF